MPRLTVPTTGRLPSKLRVHSSNPTVQKNLSRLTRDTLISLALDWLADGSLPQAKPYLIIGQDDDPDDLYPPCRSVEEVQQLYLEMQQQKGSKRDVITRILEGDWRHGITLYQLAMADLAFFEQNSRAQKWSAYSILRLKQPSQGVDDEILRVDSKNLEVPNFRPSTFLQNLQAQALPDVKAHYHFHRPKDLPVLILRVFVIDSPYNTNLALTSRNSAGAAANFESSRTIYIAFPDGSPSLFITKSQSTGSTGQGEAKSLQSLIVDGVPKALSRPRQRYTLKAAHLISKNLHALLETKGPGRTNAAAGGWAIYANESSKASPLDTVLPKPPLPQGSSNADGKRASVESRSQQATKRAKLIAKARFGGSGIVTDGKGLERVDIVLQDPYPSSLAPMENDEQEDDGNDGDSRNGTRRRRSQINATIQEAGGAEDDGHNGGDREREHAGDGWVPNVKITFNGPHVWAGVRQLVEAGMIDGERMPGWMTGEEGVTTGVVRRGRICGHRGSGI